MSGDVLSRLDLLYRIGEEEGANRPGLSQAEEEAHRLAGEWLVEAGAEVTRDTVGNSFGRLTGDDPDAPELWVGSHLDSVPRADGSTGRSGSSPRSQRLNGFVAVDSVARLRQSPFGMRRAGVLDAASSGAEPSAVWSEKATLLSVIGPA